MTSLLQPQTVLTISVLTLAVWLVAFFWMPDYPLSGDQTTIVAAVCSLVVIGSKRALGVFQRRARTT